jgi:hypothetical protein
LPLFRLLSLRKTRRRFPDIEQDIEVLTDLQGGYSSWGSIFRTSVDLPSFIRLAGRFFTETEKPVQGRPGVTSDQDESGEDRQFQFRIGLAMGSGFSKSLLLFSHMTSWESCLDWADPLSLHRITGIDSEVFKAVFGLICLKGSADLKRKALAYNQERVGQ